MPQEKGPRRQQIPHTPKEDFFLCNGWNRSANNAEWGSDYLMRAGTARSNMFDNRPTGTQYFYTDDDSNGDQLEGTFSLYIRAYWGKEALLDGTWVPPRIERVQ